jgi:hypothetical protein
MRIIFGSSKVAEEAAAEAICAGGSWIFVGSAG